MKRYVLIACLMLLVIFLMELILRPEVFRNSLARELSSLKLYDKSSRVLEPGRGDESGIPEANIARNKYKQGHSKEAEADFDSALEKAPDDPDLLYDLGNVAYNEKDYQKAVDRYSQALLKNPQDKDAKANLELAMKMLKQNPPPKPKQDEKQQEKKDKEEVKNLLDALDNKEARDRKERQPQAPPRTDNWW